MASISPAISATFADCRILPPINACAEIYCISAQFSGKCATKIFDLSCNLVSDKRGWTSNELPISWARISVHSGFRNSSSNVLKQAYGSKVLAYTQVHIHVHTHAHEHARTCMHAHKHTCTHTCTRTRILQKNK